MVHQVGELDRERVTERSRLASALLPIAANLERAIAHTTGQSGVILEGPAKHSRSAFQVLAQLSRCADRFDRRPPRQSAAVHR